MSDSPIYDSFDSDEVISITPNNVIHNPNTRRKLGIVFYVLLFITGATTLTFSFIPELQFGSDLPLRTVLLVSTLSTWGASAFGIVVTTPNVPKG